MTIVVNEVGMAPVRFLQKAKRFKRTPTGGMIPTYPEDLEGQDMTFMDVNPSELECPLVSVGDFMTALSKIIPSINDKDF